MKADMSLQLQQHVQSAYEDKVALKIIGGNSKAFYGRAVTAETISLAEHSGVLKYEPTELVITVRSGTPLKEIEALLDEHGQMLPFEPPAFNEYATIGGTIACNLSGPRRAYAGAARDYLLGCKIINGKGEMLTFGGEVMKNVAGYDVSRLVTGSMGTLGVLLQFSIKVLPKPVSTSTLIHPCAIDEALNLMNRIKGNPLPVDAVCYHEGNLYIRLSGSISAVEAGCNQLSGDVFRDGELFWHQLREHKLAFFNTDKPLWRLSVKPSTPMLALDGDQLIDWGGAQRWLISEVPEQTIRAVSAEAGGHAILFRGGDRNGEVFHPLPSALMTIHQRLKNTFDPGGVFNPGTMYAEL